MSDESSQPVDTMHPDEGASPQVAAPTAQETPAPAAPQMPAGGANGAEAVAPVEAAPALKPLKRLPTAAEIQPPSDPAPAEHKMDWYILKVQSNREESIREALQRRVKMQGMEEYFGDIIVPVEMRTEFKNGKKRVAKHKLYPGYLVVRMEITDDSWFLVRETPGIGDFTGAGGKPSPMLQHEVNKILSKSEEKTDEQPKVSIKFNKGDRVKINEGTFENFEGDVENIDMANGRVTVMINIFGRSTPVELEYWQIEAV